jgi:hypothetical protein
VPMITPDEPAGSWRSSPPTGSPSAGSRRAPHGPDRARHTGDGVQLRSPAC